MEILADEMLSMTYNHRWNVDYSIQNRNEIKWNY